MSDKKIDHATVLATFSSLSDIKCWPAILDGRMDFELKVMCYYQEKHQLPNEEELNLPWVDEFASNIKNNLRKYIQDSINRESLRERENYLRELREARINKENALKSIHKKMQQNASVDAKGTIKEIAERNGLSISEVRKMKKAGRLSELD